MELIADETIKTTWITALRDAGHEGHRVVAVDRLGLGAGDGAILDVARELSLVLLTADQADFSDPPTVSHPGIIIVTDERLTGGELVRAVERIDRVLPSVTGKRIYVTDWIN